MYIYQSSKIFSEALESLSSKVIYCTFLIYYQLGLMYLILQLFSSIDSFESASTSEKFELAVQIFMWSS